ncbi:hypothetical protein [Teredinibacter haidensis]|uniref:hypothetical protein n=1 Tax=Teredinibacter haidensis TaxID=2731755 RepID=UPI000948F5BB|nr:hypothetical protein [Teredinibacter haidensis]
MPLEDGSRHDNPSARVDYLLRRSGSVSPWDFNRLTDEAVTHAADNGRRDSLASSRAWRPLGPRNLGGRIRCLAQDERDPDTVYAGSGHGGLWRTRDAGDTWEVLDYLDPPGVHHGVPIGAVAISYSNPEILYIGTGEPTRSPPAGTVRDIPGNGLYWSTNGGESFQQIDEPDIGEGDIGASQYETIVVDPWEPKRLWIASPDRGLARGIPPVFGGTPNFHRDNIDHAAAPAAGSQQASDIWVDFGASRTTPPTTVTVYAALWGNGVYRAVYNRNNDSWQGATGSVWTQITPAFPAGFTRIKISVCRQQSNWIAAVAGLGAADNTTNVFLSNNQGNAASWVDTGSRAAAGDTGTQASYDLVLGVHPSNPAIIITGSVELFLGRHNAVASTTVWSRILNWQQHDLGDRAQHADQHALLFDAADPRRIWVGNDGGLSSSVNLGTTWRERGLGINAAQFYDISSHPTYPYIYGGGLQDNGTWLSYGGQTWYHVNGADGGEVAFDPTNPRNFFATWQGGFDQTTIQSIVAAIGSNNYMNRLPDVPQVGGNDVNQQAALTVAGTGIAGVHGATFVGIIAQHPTLANHVLVGRNGAAYLSTNGVNFNQVNTGAFTGANDPVSKIVYSPQTPNTNWWVATEQGQLFFTNDANATAWTELAAAASATVHDSDPAVTVQSAGNYITGVAVNRSNDAIIAISVTLRTSVGGAQGFVFLSGDRGVTWCEISGRCDPCSSGGSDQLNPSAATALVFDPGSSTNVANTQTLYCGTMAGVYVIRNAIAPSGSITNFNPEWHTFNGGLPLTLIFDLESVTFQDAGGTAQNLLRCATHARGAYECDLGGAPPVKLLIRDNIVDDGRRYAAAHQVPNNHDPRMTAGATAVMQLNRALDLRIDTPPYRYFGSAMDGLEFDEHLRSQSLAAGKKNIVYLQLNNVGSGRSTNAQLNIYWAQASGAPLQAPDLQADFWTQFPNVEDGGVWQKVGGKQINSLPSGQPLVVGFKWNVPGQLTGEIALLAIASDPDQDALNTAGLGLVVDPAKAGSFIGTERRTALRQTPVLPAPPDALLRDGFDDLGNLGETAWGARSHDIIVVHAADPTPAATFADGTDLRKSDVLDGSETNHIYVRVNNAGSRPLSNVAVEVFDIPFATLEDPSTWVTRGTVNLANIAANTSAIMPAIQWPTPADPAPNNGYLLFALVQADGDPRPDFLARVDSLASVWEMVLEAVDSGNAVLRGIKWQS